MKSLRYITLALAIALGAAALPACGSPDEQSVDMEFQVGSVSHRIQGVYSVVPYSDPLSLKPYQIKVGDMSGTPFGSDNVTFGPLPTGYPIPADIHQCFWQMSSLKEDGTPQQQCGCLVAQVDASWAGTYNVATPPGGTSPVNLLVGWPGTNAKMYIPCFDRTDRGYFLKNGKVEFRG